MMDFLFQLAYIYHCVQQASYLGGGPLLWILPLYLHLNKKSDDEDNDDDELGASLISLQSERLRPRSFLRCRLGHE